MIKKFNLKFIVFLIAFLYATVLSAQINTPSGAVVPFNSNLNYNGNGNMPTNLPSGGTYGKSQDAADAYNEWKANYTEACTGGMIRVKFDEPNKTVSEGIGYGMQLAAYAADKALFDGLYTYWINFKSPNSSGKAGKLMNWRISGCSGVTGSGSASDADVDAAWALMIAETQWPSINTPYNYGAEANNILNSIKELEVLNGILINGDGWGFSDQCRNPSYQSPGYYKFFQTVNASNSGTWSGAIDVAHNFISSNRDASTGLISDWSTPGGVRNTCNPGGLGQAATDGYGYDACRNPWRMAQDVLWNNEPRAQAICDKLAGYINTKGAGNVGGPLYQNGNNYAGFAHNATFVSTFAMAVMGATPNTTNKALINAMYTETKKTKDVIKNSTLSGYFGNTLRCVSLFMMTGNTWKYGTTSFQDINVRRATSPINILTNTDYDFQTQQIGKSGKLGTFTIENLGFANLTLTGAPIVKLAGTNAADFILVQPTLASLALSQTTNFTVTFNPTTVGDKTATLTIASNDPDEPSYVINLIGTGTLNATSPKISVFDAETGITVANNGTVSMGTSSAGSLDIKRFGIINLGDAVLNIPSLTAPTGTVGYKAAGTGYAVVTAPAGAVGPVTVAVGDTGYVYVQVLSASAGTPAGSLTISSDDNANASYKINLTSNFVACGTAVSTNGIYQDFDGNYNNSSSGPIAGFTELVDNPSISNINPSPKVAELVRSISEYQGPRYSLCGTGAVNLTASKFAISMLVYSPAAGVTIKMGLKTDADVADEVTYPERSGATAVTTKVNQWERLYFNHAGAIGVAGIKNIEIYISPTIPITGGTYYIDDIKLDAAPCLSDISGTILDFNQHNNVTLDYNVAGYTPSAVNDKIEGLNTSSNIGKFSKSAATLAYADGLRYVGCGGKFDVSTKKYISVLVYSTVANAKISISPKIGATDAIEIAPSALTVFANQWHRLFFDLSGVAPADISKITGIDIFFDPLNDKGAQTYRFDDIRYESAPPCVAGIEATDILNDFESNRYLNLAFPGEVAQAPDVTYFNTVTTNPSKLGENLTPVVGKFVRGTETSGTSFRFAACQSKLDLTSGHNIIELKVYSANANVPIVMSLKGAADVTLANVTDTIKKANTWTTLRFDFTQLLNATNVTNIDVVVDPNSDFSGASSTAAARTYYIDELRYALPSPEINLQALTTPDLTDLPTQSAFNMGTIAVGDSSFTNVNIQNNGLETLTLTGTGIASVVVGGANASDFKVTASPSFSTSIGALSASGFTITFKPSAAGPRSASITIKSNDGNEGTYVVYLTGTGSSAIIKVVDGKLPTSTVIATNNITPILIGSADIGVDSAPAYSMSIKNTGVAPLTITSIKASAGFTLSPVLPTGSILTGKVATFTIVGKPLVVGANAGTITIVTNDPTTPTYVVNVTVTGNELATSKLQVLNLSVIVPNNNTPAIELPSPVVNKVSTPKMFTIKNTGTAPLIVGTITATTGFSVLPSAKTTIAPGDTALFFVSGTPTSTTVATTGIITIPSNDPASPYKIAVSVIGKEAPKAIVQVLDGAAIIANNNTVKVELTSPIVNSPSIAKTFTISNTGTAELTIGTITATGGFIVTQVTSGPIAAGATATFTVSGTPNSSIVASTSIISIPSNDLTSPYIINVSVIGTDAPVVKAQVLVDGLSILNDNTPAIELISPLINMPSEFKMITIKNNGSADLTIGSITATAGFTIIQSAKTTITPGDTALVFVSGTPTSTTTATLGSVSIPSNDPASPFKVNVSVIGKEAATAIVQVLNGATVIENNNLTAVTLPSPETNTASQAKVFTIQNMGTGPLTIGEITATAGFIVTQVTTGPIAAGANATFTVSGIPTSSTSATESIITIPSNDEASPYKVKVSVIGTDNGVAMLIALDGLTLIENNNVAPVELNPALINTLSAAKIITIVNTGTAPLTVLTITATAGFTVTQVATGPIAPSATATFTVSGTPTSTTVATEGSISISSNDPASPYIIKVSVIGTNDAIAIAQVLDGASIIANNNTTAIQLTAPPVNEESAPKTFTIQNAGSDPLIIGTITATAGFTVTQVSDPIAPGETATFTVSGTPTSTTVATESIITIPSNDPASPYKVKVSVIGQSALSAIVQVLDATTIVANNNANPIVLTPSQINVASAPKTFTIINKGSGPLTIGTISATAGFTVSQITAPIAAGETATFTVSGTPTSTSVATLSSITIPSNDVSSPYIINVSVKAALAETATITIAGVTNNNVTPIFLGEVVVGTSTPVKTLTITNSGSVPLTIGDIESSNPDFVVTAVTPNPIQPGQTGTFTIVGKPSAATTSTGTITIPSNDPNGPFVINVSTTGKTQSLGGELQVLGFENEIVSPNTTFMIGSNAINKATNPYTFTLKNIGSQTLTISNISTLNGFTIVKQAASKVLLPGATQTFSVVGVPKSASAPTIGLISITSDEENSPFIINVGVTVGMPTGVATALASSAIDLYPNPSQGITNLVFNGTFDDVQVTVYTIDGSEVFTTDLSTMDNSAAALELQELPSGIYIIEVSTVQGKLIKRFIKN